MIPIHLLSKSLIADNHMTDVIDPHVLPEGYAGIGRVDRFYKQAVHSFTQDVYKHSGTVLTR